MAAQATPKPKAGIAIDPALQAIFDSMATYMTSGSYTSMTTTVSAQSNGTNQTVSLADGTGATWNATQFTPGPRITISPMGTTIGAAGTQQFTATATNPDGSAIPSPAFTWSVTGQGTIDATGLYTAPATIATAATDTIKCALQGSPSYATTIITLQASVH